MKVLLLNTPFLPMYSRASRSPAVTKSSTLYYPLWLAYTTGVLEEDDFEVRLIDAPAMRWEKENVYEFVREFKPDLSIVDTTTPSIYSDEEIAKKIKKISGNTVILVGTHASALPEQVLKETENIDAVIRGEYDYIIRDIARKIRRGEEWKKEKGISYINKNGKVIHNQDREKIENLNEIPFVSKVYKNHLSRYIKRYFYGANMHPVMTILSGRGCPYKCCYCVYPQVMLGHKYRYRSVENVVDELEYIKENFPYVKEIFLEDDTLTINKERTIELCREIVRRKLKIVWSTNSRAQVDYETLKEMKKSGCRLLCVGYESGDQKVLDNIGKGLKLEEIYQFTKDAKKAGILIHGCFLVGNPGETKETLEKTLEMAKKLNPDTAQFYPVMAYPGTRLYKWAEENGYLKNKNFREWVTKEGLHNCLVSTPHLTEKDLKEWADNARREFYMRPKYIIRKLIQALRHPKEITRIIRGANSLLHFIFQKNGHST